MRCNTYKCHHFRLCVNKIRFLISCRIFLSNFTFTGPKGKGKVLVKFWHWSANCREPLRPEYLPSWWCGVTIPPGRCRCCWSFLDKLLSRGKTGCQIFCKLRSCWCKTCRPAFSTPAGSFDSLSSLLKPVEWIQKLTETKSIKMFWIEYQLLWE